MSSSFYFKNQRYEKLKKQLTEQKCLFVDSQFPTTVATLGSTAEALTESEAVEWKRPQDLCDNPRLVSEGQSLVDINGGKISCDWFLQALQILSGIKELLFKVIVNTSEQEFNTEKYLGLFRFRFWRFGHWVEVVVDDYLPCSEGRLLFSQFSDPGQFWPCLLEKAYAKLLGSYGALEQGHISDALVDLTGGVTEILNLRASDINISEDARANLYHSLAEEMSVHSIICASIPAKRQEDVGEKTQEGLITGRMYHVTALKKIHITDVKLRNLFKGREKLAVIRVRDTCGSQASSVLSSPTRSTDSSTEADSKELTATQLTKMLSRKTAWSRLKSEDHSRFGLTVETEKELWMPFEDFACYFHELIIVRLYNNNIFTLGRHWNDYCLRGTWALPDRSGGGNNSKSASFFQNPQFLIDIKNDEDEIVLQMLQEGGTEPASASSGTQRHKYLAVGVAIFHVEVNRKHRMHRQWGFTPLVVSVDHQRRRELSYKGSLSRGRYLLIPTAFRPGSEGNFLIRVISQNVVSLREAFLDVPSERCGLSCISSPVVWVTVVSVKNAVGLPAPKNVFCIVKCEGQQSQTGICRESKEITWDGAFVFHRRKPERPIVVKVFNHNTVTPNQFLGMIELQARVNHAPTTLEVTLLDKQGSALVGRLLTIEILTEDDLTAVLSQQYNDELCSKYNLVPQDVYSLNEDVSHECSSNECIILASTVLTNDQSFNAWCYRNKTAYAAYSHCSNILNWNDYKGKQVKFSCKLPNDGCNVPETSCIPDWMENCKSDGYGCPVFAATETSTVSSTDETISTVTSESTFTEVTPTLMTPETSTAAPFCQQALCPSGECFFGDHCYFISPIFTLAERKPPIVSDVCGQNQSLARGLAVESREENEFVEKFIRNSEFSWTGANFYPPALYAICERELVWSVAVPSLRQSCYNEYVNQRCNSSFCCAADDEKQIWFQCEGSEKTVATKQCIGDASNVAKWTCSNGSFTAEAPDTSQCQCESVCSEEFNGTLFSACPLKYAYAACPDDGKGYMRWRCLENGTFDGITPDKDLCCESDEMLYNRQDPFLNVWVACPNTTVTRYVPAWSEGTLAGSQCCTVNWRCGPSGFDGLTPDYSSCYDCIETCNAVDDRGQLWFACRGTIAQHPCPDGLKGNVSWRCDNSSSFVDDAPDYSECYPTWVDDVEDMITKNKEAIIIMNKIHEELKIDLSGTGLKKVINITSSCINLFSNQNPGNGSVLSFENFTRTYLDVLDDLTQNVSIWTQLSDNRKDDYIHETIEMTNRIALALKEVSSEDIAGYNKAFQSEATVLSLWMAYARNLTQVVFPYEASKNTCSVDLYNIEPSSENALFSAVGIVFPHLVSVAAFPVRGMGAAVMNSAVLSMTVADVTTNLPVRQRNVSMRVSFKHSTKARSPDRKIISRRLYGDETPSPIIGASRCFFYDTEQYPGTWSSSGCTVSLSSAQETICHCQHLTSFSVLVDVHEYVRDPALEAFSLTCSILSIIGLISTLVVFKAVKVRKLKLDSDRTLIDVNCCLCLLVSHAMIVTVLDKRFFFVSDKMCSVVAGILHYFLTAAFFWMSVEAYHLYHLIVLVFTREGSCRSHYFIIGYLLPLIPIMLTELASQVLQKPAYGRDEICWLEIDFIWSFNGPAFLLTGVNLVVIIIAMRAAITKKENNSFQKWWIWCKGLAFLCTLLGVTWLVGLVYMETDLPDIVQYLFVLLNGLQGVYIFIFQCILNNQVRPVLVQFFMRRTRKTHHSSFSRISQKATAISSEVDCSAKTGISSLGPSSDVKIVQCLPVQPGQWMFRADSPRRQWANSNVVPCDDLVRQLQRRMTHNSEILKQ